MQELVSHLNLFGHATKHYQKVCRLTFEFVAANISSNLNIHLLISFFGKMS